MDSLYTCGSDEQDKNWETHPLPDPFQLLLDKYFLTGYGFLFVPPTNSEAQIFSYPVSKHDRRSFQQLDIEFCVPILSLHLSARCQITPSLSAPTRSKHDPVWILYIISRRLRPRCITFQIGSLLAVWTRLRWCTPPQPPHHGHRQTDRSRRARHFLRRLRFFLRIPPYLSVKESTKSPWGRVILTEYQKN